MGTLRHFLLDRFIEKYGTTTFVETGTGGGDGLLYASEFSFTKLFSTEIHEKIHLKAKSNFESDKRITLILDDSAHALDALLAGLPPEIPILFWLDAHFPGADYKLAAYDGEANGDIRLPLEREIKAILQRRPLRRDVLLIDDLRLYEEGDFAHGNLPESLADVRPQGGLNFVTEAFWPSHFIHRDYTREGYLTLVPR